MTLKKFVFDLQMFNLTEKLTNTISTWTCFKQHHFGLTIFPLSIYYCGASDWTQNFVHFMQLIYHQPLSTAVMFWDRVSLPNPWILQPSCLYFVSARIRGVYHYAWLSSDTQNFKMFNSSLYLKYKQEVIKGLQFKEI